MSEQKLEIKNVSKRFGNVIACNDVNLQITPGTSTSIIGPNGAGKSTLLNIICGEVLPDRGNVMWQDTLLIGHTIQDIARLGIARMFQDLKLFDAMTVYENMLVYAQTITRYRRAAPQRFVAGSDNIDEQIEVALRQLNLLDVADRRVRELSYAERKLVALGRVMITRASVVLLDEPASGLDKVNLEIMLEVIEALKASGTVLLVVEHNLSIVERLASRAILIEEGSVIADGSPAEVFRDSNFGRVYFALQETT
ncbi:ATP-binding cassette domain-containing protein [Sneathiella sp.]|uniref:ATP-binding cassette domain-containing protein n=1 Tax=Sneathiella sp. TaxID=1964365 RepID=UPI003562858C